MMIILENPEYYGMALKIILFFCQLFSLRSTLENLLRVRKI